MSKRFPGRRLSPLRLTVLIVAVVAVAVAGLYALRGWQDEQSADRSTPWFAAYVDVTATPAYAFETPRANIDRDVILGFVVASNPSECVASWGGYHTLEEAQTGLDLDRRIARLRQSGGDVIVSFGGRDNTELALACGTVEELTAQYRAVVDRYEPAAIDLDIEGEALGDAASRLLRAQAIAALQAELDEPLPVWVTLPVGPEGMTPDGVETVRILLEAGVSVAGVNAMTMNFTGEAAADDQVEVAASALRGIHRQLMAIYADRNEAIGERTAWRMVGATPMIGQNDVASEVFSPADAEALNAFAIEQGLGRMSMWSANRDRSCAAAYANLRTVSDSCSGVGQDGARFAELLGEGFEGRADGHGVVETTPPVQPEEYLDDPETSPYPIWDQDSSYPPESRVVWRHNVYVAKWWSTREQPDDPSIPASDSPWQLIGPVLPGESPLPQPELPKGFYPEWSPDEVYEREERVLFDNVAYVAKWWTQDDNPAAGQANPGASPWRALTVRELEELIDTAG